MSSTLRVRAHDGDQRKWWEITEDLLRINTDEIVAPNIHVVDNEDGQRMFDIILGADINPIWALNLIRLLGFEQVLSEPVVVR